MNEKEIRTMLHEGLVSLRYVKRNGETRNAVGTLNLMFIPADKHPLKPNVRKSTPWVKEDYVRYYDFTVQDWRCLVCSEILGAKPIESLSPAPIPDVPSPTRSLPPIGRGEKMENASLIANDHERRN